MSDAPLTPDDRTVVEAHLRQLGPTELAAFVADLWAAQGFETDRDGLVVTAVKGGEPLTIRVTDSAPRKMSLADAVVVTGGGTTEGTGWLDAGDLTERLWYAVDRPAARDLCRQHLGAPPAELSLPVSMRVRRLASTPVSPTVTAVLVLALLTALAFGIVVGTGWLSDGEDGETQLSAGDTPTPDTAQVDRSRVSATLPVDSENLPPGVTRDGITDIEALATAHNSTIDNQSYTILLDRYQPEIWNRRVVDVHRDFDIAVSNGTYLLDAVQIADGETIPMGTLYHDGSNTYMAQPSFSGIAYQRVPPLDERRSYPPPPHVLTNRLVSTRLSTPTTNLVGAVRQDGDRLYLLTGSGQPEWPTIGEVEQYNVSALVTDSGLVREVTVTYRIRDGDRLVNVRREVIYDNVGETTVSPPDWYIEEFGGNETDA